MSVRSCPLLFWSFLLMVSQLLTHLFDTKKLIDCLLGPAIVTHFVQSVYDSGQSYGFARWYSRWLGANQQHLWRKCQGTPIQHELHWAIRCKGAGRRHELQDGQGWGIIHSFSFIHSVALVPNCKQMTNIIYSWYMFIWYGIGIQIKPWLTIHNYTV